MPHLGNAQTGVIAPPATTVRKGEWKLIRFYDTEEGWPDEHELYNLREDLGEQHNLAGSMPEKVRELDALIDGFLAQTGALVPRQNPAYDPEALAVVDGWRASGHAKLLRGESFLRIVSTGGDPFVWTQEVPKARGKLVANFRMRSDGKGIGQFFWADQKTPQFGPTVRLDLSPVHDGQWHDYAVQFTTNGPLRQIRIDPGTAPGQIDLARVWLCDETGQELQAWEFGK